MLAGLAGSEAFYSLHSRTFVREMSHPPSGKVRVFKSGAQRKVLLDCNAPEEIHGKLLSDAATIGVVSALISGFAFSALQSPPSDSPSAALLTAYGLTMSLAGILCLAAVILSTITFVIVNLLPPESGRHAAEAIIKWQPLPARFFIVGSLAEGVGFILYLFGEYSDTAAYIFLAVTVVTIVGLLFAWTRMRKAAIALGLRRPWANDVQDLAKIDRNQEASGGVQAAL